jgi:hypothetical protein
VRVYVFGGAQHSPATGPSTRGQQPANPNNYRPLQEALFLAMDQWLTDGTEPPPSAHPRVMDGTLLPWEEEAVGWLPIPGVVYPTVIQQPEFLDYGDAFDRDRRIDVHPPRRSGNRYGVMVPALDRDNNERGVLRLPRVSVPVATYTGWNLRNPDIGAPTELLDLNGSRIPFPPTAVERARIGDPRESVVERYVGFDAYKARYLAAGAQLVTDRYLLPEHRPALEVIADDQRTLFAEP